MKLSCIVPAFNEAERISQVVAVLSGHNLIDEVIVVDDASIDNTAEIVGKFPNVTLIRFEVNKGKTQAVLAGLNKARNNAVMLIDADLVGLTAEAITALITPVIQGTADVSISLRKNALLVYKLAGVDFVSGERVFDKALLLDHEEQLKKVSGFGLEVFMNNLIISKQLRLAVVQWNTVVSPRKSVKTMI